MNEPNKPADHLRELKQFASVVKKMRDAQREYFRERGLGMICPDTLRIAKDAEKLVDRAIMVIQMPEQTPSLF